MPWFKVDDQLHAHRKARVAGVAAMGLWTLAGSWCSANLQDGFIPESICAQWSPQYRKLGKALVIAGLWEAAKQDGEAGWHFKDWLEYQPSAATTRKKRAEARERMATLRAVSG